MWKLPEYICSVIDTITSLNRAFPIGDDPFGQDPHAEAAWSSKGPFLLGCSNQGKPAD